jgi:hypothetical protein
LKLNQKSDGQRPPAAAP